MIKLTEEQISDIAQELEIGMLCFIHKETGEMKSYPNDIYEQEQWQDVIDEIDNDAESYIDIEGMNSSESYRLMERFIDTVDDKQLANRLFNAINVARPFHTFKYELDYSDEYRKKWYNFKSKEMIEWVRDQLYPETHPLPPPFKEYVSKPSFNHQVTKTPRIKPSRINRFVSL